MAPFSSPSPPSATPLGRAQLRYFLINRGPWDMLDRNRPFLLGVPEKPEGGNFYPPGATKEQVARWEASLPPEQRARASGFFTTVRASPDGSFSILPYSEAYQGELALAAAFLRDAARLTAQPTLKAYLEKRADAFLTNDYYPSDVAWMELDASIEPTIGPYEVYEDGWFNAKAAFEAFITVRDEAGLGQAGAFLLRAPGVGERTAPREPVQESKARCARAHSRGEQPLSAPAMGTTACKRPLSTSPTTSGW